MHIVLGGTGRVGSAVAAALLERGEQVTVVTHDAAAAADRAPRGAAIAEADVGDPDALRGVFRTGRRAYLLNPPADPATDTDAEERRTVAAILAALDGSGLDRVVAASTYGVQPGEGIGDLGVLHELEQGLRAQPIPAAVVRGAYYFSNLDMLLGPAASDGELPTMFPPDLTLPMVAPADLGRAAAELLIAGATGVHPVEGPERPSFADVADAFAAALGRPVRPVVTPRGRWVQEFRQLGFSAAAARSYAGMTAATVDGDWPLPDSPIRGSVRLRDYVAGLVAEGGNAPGIGSGAGDP